MKLKTATLIVMICQIVSLIYWQCFSIAHLYKYFGEGLQMGLNLVVALIGQGSFILFFIVLYSKQSGASHE